MIVCKKKKNQFTYLVAVPQFGGSLIGRHWRLSYRFGHRVTDLATVLQIWLPCHIFGHRTSDLSILTLIWHPCNKFGSAPCHIFGRHATDLATVLQRYLQKIWLFLFCATSN